MVCNFIVLLRTVCNLRLKMAHFLNFLFNLIKLGLSKSLKSKAENGRLVTQRAE